MMLGSKNQLPKHEKPPVILNNCLDFPLYRELLKDDIEKNEKYVQEDREQQKKKFSEIGQEPDLSKEKIKQFMMITIIRKLIWRWIE